MHYEITESSAVITVDGQYAGKSLSFLADRLFLNSRTVNRKLQEKQILLNGTPLTDAETILPKNGRLTILLEPQTPGWPASDTPCTIVYRNPFIAAVHKNAGRIIHEEGYGTECLNADMAARLLAEDIHAPVRPLHRLDRETEGLVLYSLIPLFQPWFDNALAEHRIQRTYLALTKGICTPGKTMTIRKPLGRDRHVNGKYRVSPTGKDALTEAECIACRNGFSLFKCTLGTGRTHQIRVHLADAGYPIVNDPLYGVHTKTVQGMGLWACEVTVRDPLSGSRHRIKDPLAPDWYRQFTNMTEQ